MTSSTPRRVPVATYRLQLCDGFGFAAAAGLVDYLDALGVSHAYLSPVSRARAGSPHGYDIVDHTVLSPDLGGPDAFAALEDAIRRRRMGIVLDVVPNHMCVLGAENVWWNDVLENGPSSPFAHYFDVDWLPPKADLVDKVLLPILGDQYGRVLENAELRVSFAQGAFVLEYYEHRLPVAPRAWREILEPALGSMSAELGAEAPAVLEMESVLTAITHLPLRSETAPERVRERQREKEVVKRRLGALAESVPQAQAAIDTSLRDLNGRRGDPRSFDRLERLLEDQAYRLSYWRVASDEINYRRFFDVNELAAVRVEVPEVFEAVHAVPFRLFAEGTVDGLRIDHVDGLLDPSAYLERLPAGAYVVVEKILMGDERLPARWPVHGTTGYDFLNLVGGLFVEADGRRALEAIHGRFTGLYDPPADVTYDSRKLVLDVSLSSELTVLSRRLDRISEQHRYARDFTLNSLQAALAEVIACFPVYRTYVHAETGLVAPEDRRIIETAVRLAKRRNRATSASVFDFIASVLLLEDPEGLDEPQRRERREFVMRFQQITGPVMAKGLEDTASYRYHPLASLSEVGADPSAEVSVLRFHRENTERLRAWPHTMLATSTHDTKRGEDVRARIAVLSEVAEPFEAALRRWRFTAASGRTTVDEAEAPDASAEYLLYQTLVGTWPLGGEGRPPGPEYVGRIQAYMRKALREAKLRTSWVSPNEPYEQAVDGFVAALLDPVTGRQFLHEFEAFLRPLVRPGLLNSASQAVLKMAAPGVPDFYQGSELWEFSLVDPDNRRPVDFPRRRRLLEELDVPGPAPAERARRLLDDIEDGRLKLFATSRGLRFRRRCHDLFAGGAYHPLRARGARSEHLAAFARVGSGAAALALAARFFTRLPWPPVGAAAWEDAVVITGETGTVYRDVFTLRELRARPGANGLELPLAEVFADLPFALLERTS